MPLPRIEKPIFIPDLAAEEAPHFLYRNIERVWAYISSLTRGNFLPVPERDTVVNATQGRRYSDLAVALGELANGDVLLVGPGTFSGAFTLSVNGVLMIGSTQDSVANLNGGTTGHALVIGGGDNVLIGITAQTTAGSGNNYDGFSVSLSGSTNSFISCQVFQSDRHAWDIWGTNNHLIGCRNWTTDGWGLDTTSAADEMVIAGCQLRGTLGSLRLVAGADENVVVGNQLRNGFTDSGAGNVSAGNNTA